MLVGKDKKRVCHIAPKKLTMTLPKYPSFQIILEHTHYEDKLT